MRSEPFVARILFQHLWLKTNLARSQDSFQFPEWFGFSHSVMRIILLPFFLKFQISNLQFFP
jgi:hypothetical protein